MGGILATYFHFVTQARHRRAAPDHPGLRPFGPQTVRRTVSKAALNPTGRALCTHPGSGAALMFYSPTRPGRPLPDLRDAEQTLAKFNRYPPSHPQLERSAPYAKVLTRRRLASRRLFRLRRIRRPPRWRVSHVVWLWRAQRVFGRPALNCGRRYRCGWPNSELTPAHHDAFILTAPPHPS